MDKYQIKQRIDKLKAVINHHRYQYHVLDKQEISDAALDSLKKELYDLEQQYPEFITVDSPTQRVGGKPLKEFKKIKHQERMLSFNDAFSKEDMRDWQARFLKLLAEKEKNQVNFYCELKIDGLAIELIYDNGIFKTGSTRGDGNIGEDITQNLKTVEAIPLDIRSTREVVKELEKEGLKHIAENINKKGLGRIVVRGEVFISKKEFAQINKVQNQKGLPLYANPRNIAAGSARQLDPKITASRHLDSFAYDLITDFGQTTHEEKHKILNALGFKINKNNKYCQSLNEVFLFHNYWQEKREKLEYEIDGVVVIADNNKIFEKLGVVGKAPRGAIAFKFAQLQSTTQVLDIKIQVGRTGAMTPVAVLKPVRLSGITITRATLHNEDEIKRLGIKIGDTVIVGRAGDVIPDIIKVLPELRMGEEKSFKMPNFCPSCNTKLEKSATESLWRCPNSKCFARQRRAFYHFVSKGAFDIDGLGPKIIDRLLEEGLVQDTSDLFELKEGDVAGLERFAEKSAENLINSIAEKKEITLPKFIYALGIRNIGEETAIDLAENFGSVEELKNAKLKDFESISNIGPIVAKSVYEWFNAKDNLNFLDKLKRTGIKVKNPAFAKTTAGKGKLKGKIFVLTGSLSKMTRAKAREKIRNLGGDISSSISLKTSYLVAGAEPGSKINKAEKLGVKIIDEKEFLKIIN
ncbi:MAG: NAD-dependent DNA ligase LigA [Candidatus Staskawiczbacteria bacterium]|nr:NAD-dependent DNA ligase LigA [Candidatus Staskawiczbacteria bacterium]